MIRFNFQKIKQTRLPLLLLAMLLGFAGNLSAEVKLYVSDFSISPGETKEIAMNLDTDETNLARITGYIHVPEGLKIIENSAKASSNRASGAVGNANPETGQFTFAMIGGSFSGTSGPIFTFKVTATDDLAASSQITYTDVQCGPAGNLTAYSVAPTTVTNAEGGQVDPVEPVVGPSGTISCSFNVTSLAFLPKETAEKEVEVALTNADALTGFQARLKASEGIEIAGVEKSGRLSAWNYNNGRIMSIGAISGNSGTIFTVKLKAKEGFAGDATLTVSNIAATRSDATSITAEDLVLDVHVIASPVIEFSPAEPIALASGQTAQLSVVLNGESQMSMYQAKLVLPEGITAEVTNGDVATAVPAYNAEKGTIFGSGLTKRAGTLLNIKLTAGDDFVANGVVELTNVIGTTTSAYSLDVEPISLEVNAVARLLKAPAARELTYNAEDQALVEAGTASGNASVVYSLDNENFAETVPAAKNAGSYTVYYKVVAGENQVLNETAQYEPVVVGIAKAAITSVTLQSAELVYNNQEQTAVVAEVKAGELVVPAEAYSVSGATAKDKGEYTLTVTAVEDGNFTGSVTADFTIIANAENDEAYATLTAELDALVAAISEAKADIEENAADVKDDYLTQLDEMSAQVEAARTTLDAANEAVTLNSESVNNDVPTAEEIAAVAAAAKQAQADKETAEANAAKKTALEAEIAALQAALDAIVISEDDVLAVDYTALTSEKAEIQAAIDELSTWVAEQASATALTAESILPENKVTSDTETLAEALADAKAAKAAADQLAADKAAFAEYQAEQAAAVEALAEDGDSEDAQAIIAAAVEAVNALTYDESKTLAENKAAVDAVVAPVEEALEAQRTADAEAAAAAQLAADKAAFAEYQETQAAAVESLAAEGDSEEAQAIIAAAVEAINALTYDESKTLAENKAAVDALVAPVEEALNEQRAADAEAAAAAQLAADKAAFAEYQAEKSVAVEALAEDGDSEASQQIIADAVAAIEALEYDEELTLEENKAAVNEIVAPVEEALAAQREADAYTLGDVNDDGEIDIQDALLVIQKYLDDTLIVTTFIEKAADVNTDGEIDIQDALLIIEMYLSE